MNGVRTSVVLTDELVVSARMLDINVSEVCRQALEAAVEQRVEQLRGAVAAAQEAQDLLARLNGVAEAEVVG